MATQAREGGSFLRSVDVITGSDTVQSGSGGSAGAFGGMSSRLISPADADGVMFPSRDEQEETEDTTLTGHPSSKRSALERVS